MRNAIRRSRHKAIRLVAPLLVALLASPARPQIADDVVLFSTQVTPNVLIVLDNSQSMREIVWHESFDPLAPTACNYFTVGTMYAFSNDTTVNVSAPNCVASRKIYADNKLGADTLYSGKYLNWLFSASSNAAYTQISQGNNGFPSSCVGGPSFAKYQRARLDAAKQVLKDVTCLVNLAASVRFGLATFREDDPDPNGGYVQAPVDEYNSTQASDFISALQSIDADSHTPLAEAFFQLYTYFMSRNTAEIPYGKLGAAGGIKFPAYQYDVSSAQKGGRYNPSKAPPSPVQYSCQKNFIILISDGGPEQDDFVPATPTNTGNGFANFMNLIGDYNADGEVESQPNLLCAGCKTTLYLDDIALYMETNDFNLALANDQTIDTYTIGYGLIPGTWQYNLLQKTAQVGNGLFLAPKDPDSLAAAIVAAFADIIEKSQTFTAATVPATRTAAGGSFFTALFVPTAKSGYWEGHLERYAIDAAGEILDRNGNCAVDDPTPGECKSGPFLPGAQPFWDAGEQMPAPASRSLYASLGNARVPFDTTLTAADLGVATFPPTPAYTGSTALNTEGLTDEIIQNVRGCEMGTGVLTTDVATPQACVQRPWLLSDIFHSNPVVVGRPSSVVQEDSHKAFRANMTTRDRVIYAGSNGGFLEAFHAGDWQSSATPPDHDAGTGVELFGFMPWASRTKIKELPRDTNGRDYYFVDGSPAAADVWVHDTPTDTAKDDVNGTDWRTVVIGGLRQGGAQYYALDVTDPSDSSYPQYKWEFPKESDPAAFKAMFGQTWGEPVITRVRVKVGLNDNGGQGFERWVAVVSGGYDPTGNPNHPAYSATATQGRGIFMIDIKTGQLLAAKTFGSLPGQVPGMVYAMPASPAVYDLDFDGYADVIYQSDLGGNVWKWVVRNVGEDPINGGGNPTQPSWPFKKFFTAPPFTYSGTTYYKSFFFPPSGSLYKGQLWLVFGSGERTNLPFPGIANRDENNRLYVMTDLDPYEERVVPYPTLLESNLTDFTSNTACQTLSTRGYFLKAGDGEKFVTNTEIFANFVVATSYTPTPSSDPCEIGGLSRLYVFRIYCGEAHLTDTNGNPTTHIDLGTGMPTDPRLTVSPEEGGNRLIINQQTGGVINLEAPPLDDGGLGQLYWRELTQ
jgi:type IV pilus assembly protein PilY1